MESSYKAAVSGGGGVVAGYNTQIAKILLGKRVNRGLSLDEAQRAKERLSEIYNSVFAQEDGGGSEAFAGGDMNDDDESEAIDYSNSLESMHSAWRFIDYFTTSTLSAYREVNGDSYDDSVISTANVLRQRHTDMNDMINKMALFNEGAQLLDYAGQGVDPNILRRMTAHAYTQLEDYSNNIVNFNNVLLKNLYYKQQSNYELSQNENDIVTSYRSMYAHLSDIVNTTNGLDRIADEIIDYGADDLKEVMNNLYYAMENENVLVSVQGDDDIDIDIYDGEFIDDDGIEDPAIVSETVDLEYQVAYSALQQMQYLGAHAEFSASPYVQAEVFAKGESDILSSDAVHMMEVTFGLRPSSDDEVNRLFKNVARSIPNFNTLVNDFIIKEQSDNSDLYSVYASAFNAAGAVFLGHVAETMMNRKPENAASTQLLYASAVSAQKNLSKAILYNFISNDNVFDSYSSADIRIQDRYQALLENGGIDRLASLKDSYKIRAANKYRYLDSIVSAANYYNEYADNKNDYTYYTVISYVQRLKQLADYAPSYFQLYQPTFVDLTAAKTSWRYYEEEKIPSLPRYSVATTAAPKSSNSSSSKPQQSLIITNRLLDLFKEAGFATKDSTINRVKLERTVEETGGLKSFEFDSRSMFDKKPIKWIKQGLKAFDSNYVTDEARSYASWALKQLEDGYPLVESYSMKEYLPERLSLFKNPDYVLNAVVQMSFDKWNKRYGGIAQRHFGNNNAKLFTIDDALPNARDAKLRAKKEREQLKRAFRFEDLQTPSNNNNDIEIVSISTRPPPPSLASVFTGSTAMYDTEEVKYPLLPVHEALKYIHYQSMKAIDLSKSVLQSEVAAYYQRIVNDVEMITSADAAAGGDIPPLRERIQMYQSRLDTYLEEIKEASAPVIDLYYKRQRVDQVTDRIISNTREKSKLEQVLIELQTEIKAASAPAGVDTMTQTIKAAVAQSKITYEQEKIRELNKKNEELAKERDKYNEEIARLQAQVYSSSAAQYRFQYRQEESKASVADRLKDRAEYTLMRGSAVEIVKYLDKMYGDSVRLYPGDRATRYKIVGEYKQLVSLLESGSFGKLLAYGKNVSDSDMRRAYDIISDISREVVSKYKSKMIDEAMIDVDNQDETIIEQGIDVEDLIDSTKLRDLLNINRKLREDASLFESRADEIKKELAREYTKLESAQNEYTKLEKKLATETAQLDKIVATTVTLKKGEVEKLDKAVVESRERGDQLIALQEKEAALKLAIQNNPSMQQLQQKMASARYSIKDLKAEKVKLEKSIDEDYKMSIELDVQNAKLISQRFINYKVAAAKANAQQRFQDITNAQNTGLYTNQLMAYYALKNPLVAYSDNIDAIEKYGKFLGVDVEILSSEKKTLYPADMEKFVYNLEYLHNFDFPVPALRDFFQSDVFVKFKDNIVSDYVSNLAKVQSYAVLVDTFANDYNMGAEERDLLKKKMTSDEAGMEVKKATQRIKVIEEVAHSVSNQIIKDVTSASIKYAKLKGVLGGDDSYFVEKYNNAAAQFTQALGYLATASTESKSSSGNVSGIGYAANTIQKKFNVMKEMWGSYTAEKHSQVLLPIMKEINTRTLGEFRAAVTRVNYNVQGAPYQLEAYTVTFAEKIAEAQKKIALESGKKFMSLQTSAPDYSAINQALNADHFLDAFTAINQLTNNQLSNGVKSQVKQIFANANQGIYSDLIQYIGSHAVAQLGNIIGGLPQNALKAALTDPDGFGKELMTAVVGNANVAKSKQPVFANYLGNEMQSLQNYANQSYERARYIADAAAMGQQQILQNVVSENYYKVYEVAEKLNQDPFSINNGMSKSRFLDKTAAGPQTTKSLYQFYGATPQLFQKKIASLDSNTVKQVQKDLTKQRLEVNAIQQRGGQLSSQYIVPQPERVKNMSQVVFGETLRILEENNLVSEYQRNGVMGLLSYNDFKLDRIMTSLNTVLTDNYNNSQLPEFTKYILRHGVPMLISQVEAVYYNSIDNYVFVPESVEMNIASLDYFLVDLQTGVVRQQGNAGVNAVVPSARLNEMDAQIRDFRYYLTEIRTGANNFNTQVASYNLQQLDEAFDLLKQRDKFAVQESKINEFAQSKTDSVMSSIDKMLYKLALDRSDLSSSKDANEGRQIARNAVNAMIPRAYQQLPGFGRLDYKPQTRFATAGSDFERNVTEFNKRQVRNGDGDEQQLLKSQRFTQAYRIAELNGDSIAFLRSIQLVNGVPTINGYPLSQEYRTRLARLVVALTIAVYALNYQGQASKIKELTDNKQELMDDAQDEERLPRMLILIDNMMKTVIGKRKNNTSSKG